MGFFREMRQARREIKSSWRELKNEWRSLKGEIREAVRDELHKPREQRTAEFEVVIERDHRGRPTVNPYHRRAEQRQRPFVSTVPEVVIEEGRYHTVEVPPGRVVEVKGPDGRSTQFENRDGRIGWTCLAQHIDMYVVLETNAVAELTYGGSCGIPHTNHWIYEKKGEVRHSYFRP